MAVTFKVPSSPKRSIEGIDTFLGVDMTNTGVSMENYRSPNAPNMIRNVPGKVRKRMGYYKEVYFGTPENVNYVWGTSAEATEVKIDEEHTLEEIKVYDLIQPLAVDNSTLYLEFDMKVYDVYEIYLMGPDDFLYIVSIETTQSEVGKWVHKSFTLDLDGYEGTITGIYIRSLHSQDIYFKKFSLMREKGENYEWSPAPKYYVERETNDPVFGCHFLKNNVESGTRVTNVNRVLETSDEIRSLTFQPNVESSLTYKFAEIPCGGQKVYIEFDYSLSFTSGEPYTASFCAIDIEPTNGEMVHKSGTRGLSDGWFIQEEIGFLHRADNDTGGTFRVKNLSIMYEKDENYEWSKAPEDTKDTFPLKDMYVIYPEEYSPIENVTETTDNITPTNPRSKTIYLVSASPVEQRQTHIAFDLTTSLENSSAELDYIEIAIYTRTGGPWTYISKENYNRTHFELYPYSNLAAVVAYMEVTIHLTSGNSKATIAVSGITNKGYDIREKYDVYDKWFLYHVGKQFYMRANDKNEFISVYEDANEARSQSFQIADNSYIIDGKNIYEFSIQNGAQLHPIEGERAYIPLVTFAKEPDGGGTAKDPLNLLQPGFYEQFIGRAGKTEYQLSFDGLDATTCKAWVLDAQSNWNEKREGTDFTVDRKAGKIKFTTAPGETPIQGEDSVKILAYRTVEGYRSRITKCRFGVLFGVAGACDRIFLSGNPEHPNWDFYSGFNDATYYPDTGYSVLGSAQSAITGYAIVSNYLATFKDGFDASQSVFIREGDMLTDEETQVSEAVFKLINSLQGEGAIAPFSFGYLETEPLFLTKAGVYAITEQDITGEKYSQNRSFYLDGKLRKEPNLKDAISTVYDNQYVLALNNQLYILDGLQATRTDKSEPYATRQYAGFYCTDIPATCLWTDDQICFGTTDGRICRFYSDEEALESYNDDGKPIYACWETPDLDGSLFYKNKTFRYLAVRLMKSIKTTSRLYSRKLGVWNFIREEKVIQNPIDFGNFDFELLTFSVDDTEKVLHSKVRVKKVDKARFRIENDTINEPFGLFDLALEYIESGNYKG